jgi:chorismate-pyruvate lyase
MNGPALGELVALFPGADTTFPYAVIPGDEVPAPYHDLLVHEHHMTVTVEAYHGGPVDVRVLAWRQDGSRYSRKILLVHRATGEVVQFGIVRIDLDQTTPEVRAALLARQTPVGRILIEHDVMRRIEPTAFVRIDAGPEQMAWFGEGGDGVLYGRLALIHFDGVPAVEVLEVVRP